ncbi:MAG: prepilin peptidase [Corynebacterium sp.]|nr:prepilin peptidase [Corynebacterium sp.]
MWSSIGALAIGAFWAIALCWWDIKYRRLPDNLTMPALCCVIMLAGRFHLSALLGGVVWFLLYLLIAHVVGGIGGGDIKLAPTLGIVIGAAGVWPVFAAILLAQMLSIMGAVILRQKKIPHGPAMILSTVVILLCFPASSTFIHFDRG